MSMTARDRLLAALRGDEVDRIPWSPILAYWWDFQPPSVQDRGIFGYLQEMGADALLRGQTTAFVCSDIRGFAEYEDRMNLPIPGCEIRRQVQGRDERVTYETPVGSLTMAARHSQEGNTLFVYEHPVKELDDYKTLTYLFEQMVIRPDYGPVQDLIDEVGNDGLVMPLISPFLKTPLQALVEHYVGTIQLVYDLADHPQVVEDLLAVMSARAMEAVHISAESPAEAFISWEDSSTTNLSPRIFDRYIAPEISHWGRVVHDAGKIMAHHACGHVRHLLSTMAGEDVDVIESVSPPPTGNVEIWEAQAALSPRVGVVGGIEPTHFLNLDLESLRAYVEELLARVDHRHFVLANSDSCPPGVEVEKFHLVTELVQALA